MGGLVQIVLVVGVLLPMAVLFVPIVSKSSPDYVLSN